ncbi:UDP-glucose:glycoprotein glucosyltransferase [Entamoeba marina]
MMLDPITREAQKAASLLSLLEKIYPDGIDIDTVLIKTKGHGGEFPSEFMYSVYPSTVQFENGIRKDPVLVIDNLPKTLSFQMKILPPQPVDVLLTNTSIDIDNIVMKSLNNEQQEITFTVQGLVIEAKTNKELYIGDESSFHMLTVQGDNNVTVSGAVSKDLYYQAIVPPGIYSVKEIQSDEADFNYLGDDIPMLSFTFDVKQIHFNRKEKQQIKDNSSPFKSFQKLFERTEEVINIFTIAGGKDYERTVKILMYSVQKNTKSKIKFWLFEDFLSPKARIDLLDVAKALNIQLEYVRYHWPYNMFKQVTKTRIIWANKILFLDLMFSQNLKRIIFMDADQVTRADAKELWNYDLKNHAIAMTPFCTGSWMNKETEGYRFWYQESWKAALGKHPYHISALFIVDLNKFRKDNVGGFYRAMYNNLTPDPNNLANLDQDLPNYVQNKVPIFSLPQEWLWCESWCNEGVKAKAKTIDLCNNPIHPVSKIESALANIEEWKEYDDYIKQLQESSATKDEL